MFYKIRKDDLHCTFSYSFKSHEISDLAISSNGNDNSKRVLTSVGLTKSPADKCVKKVSYNSVESLNDEAHIQLPTEINKSDYVSTRLRGVASQQQIVLRFDLLLYNKW